MNVPFPEEDIELSIPERFAKVAAQVPADFPLYQGVGGDLSYGEADRRSAGLASLLVRRLGRSTPKAVGLLLPHSGWVYPGLLGILRSGNFIVPLDVNQPADYLQQIWDDCGATVLVATRGLHAMAVSVAPGAEIIVLDELEASDTPWQTTPADPSSLAVILYTSGSTGKPKGAMRSHSGLVLTAYRMGLSGLRAGDRLSFLTPYTLAASSRAVFGGLLMGATMCGAVLRELTAEQLCYWVRDNHINGISFPPGVFRAIAALGEVISMPEVRVVSVGMEPVSHRDVDLVGRHFLPGTRFSFGYASTECGGITVFQILNGTPWEGELTPAGRPDWGIRIAILDEQLSPVAEGEVGQIAVCGRKLSRGYWNRPEINKERFLTDPLDPEGIMYLSGDLGRVVDGILEHRGRMDFMVKIRGFRVELQPIEAMLMAHPGVKEAVITAPKDKRGNPRLIAYYLVKGDAVPPSDLRDYLAAQRMPHEIPSRFIGLESFPRLGSGKVDRKSLPPPGRSRPELATAFRPPRDDQEQALVDLWAELLDLDEVGVDDDFFQLGGDSLTALEMTYRVERQGVSIPDGFYESPTIATITRQYEPEPQNRARGQDLPERDPGRLRPINLIFRRLYRMASAVGLGQAYYVVLARLLYLVCWLVGKKWTPTATRFQRYEQLYQILSPGVAPRNSAARAVQIVFLHAIWGWSMAELQSRDRKKIVSVEGTQFLFEALSTGRPIICVSFHSHSHLVGGSFLADLGIPSVGIFPERNDVTDLAATAARNTRMLRNAEEGLKRGKVVRIYPDGDRGTRSVTLPFLGRPRVFLPGFAELAVRSGAMVVTSSIRMDSSGRLRNAFGPPLGESQSADHETRVSHIQREYVRYLEAQWLADPANVRDKDVELYLASDPAHSAVK